jgi:hypothetical protein
LCSRAPNDVRILKALAGEIGSEAAVTAWKAALKYLLGLAIHHRLRNLQRMQTDVHWRELGFISLICRGAAVLVWMTITADGSKITACSLQPPCIPCPAEAVIVRHKAIQHISAGNSRSR